MRVTSAALTIAAASAGFAQALSTSCTTELAVLALGDLGSCLQLTTLLPVLSSSGSIVSDLNTYLSSLCGSSTPTCSNSTLTSAESSVSSSCSSDISGGGTDSQEVQALVAALQSYPEVYAAACSKNSTTGDYCVTDTLNTIQTDTGSNVSVSFITSLLSGSGDASSSLSSALGSGNLCTGCVAEIYQQAVKANATIASTSIGQALTSQCGSSFGTTVTGVSSASAASTSAAASSSTSNSASQPGAPMIAHLIPYTIAGASVLGSVVLGAIAVL